VPTRADRSAKPGRHALSAETEITPDKEDNFKTLLADAMAADEKTPPKAESAAPKPMNSVIVALLAVIIVLIAYIFLRGRTGKFVKEEQPPAPINNSNKVIAKPATVQPPALPPLPEDHPLASQQTKPQSAQIKKDRPSPPPPKPLPAQPNFTDDAADKSPIPNIDRRDYKREFDFDEQMAKVLTVIKKEFIIMDKKINELTQRVNVLEKGNGRP
jgi:hypothetical protein